MILLKKLQLNNFLSHEKTEINFEQNEKVLIDGASGSGKSSIIDGILWCLYGTGRASNGNIVKKGSKKGSACLHLLRYEEGEGSKETIIITRSATLSGKHTVEVATELPNGERATLSILGVREIQNWIDRDLIGASYSLFVNSIAYVQGNADSFVSQSASKRKELLLEIVKAEDYSKLYEKARQELHKNENEYNKAQGEITGLESRLDTLQGTREDGLALVKVIVKNNELLKIKESELEILEIKKEEFIKIDESIKHLDNALLVANLDLIKLNKELELTKNAVLKISGLQIMINNAPDYLNDIASKEEKLRILRVSLSNSTEKESIRNAHYAKKPIMTDRDNEIKRYREQIEFLEKKEVCPSGLDCPYHSKTLEEIEFNQTETKKIIALTKAELLTFAAWSQEEAILPPEIDIKALVIEISLLEKTIDTLKGELIEKNRIKQEIGSLEKIKLELPLIEDDLNSQEVKVRELVNLKVVAENTVSSSDRITLNNTLGEKKNECNELNKEIARNQEKIEQIEKNEQEKKNIEAKLHSIRETTLTELSEKSRKIALIKDAFSSKGIETLVIDYLLPKLEDRINEVLSKLSDFRVRIDTQTATSDGEGIKEGLWITTINDMGEELDFNNYSGGEKVRISIAISEALASLSKNIGFRLVDEAIMSLSPEMTESFTQTFKRLLEKYPQMLMISHLQEVKDLFEKIIIVKKSNGISGIDIE